MTTQSNFYRSGLMMPALLVTVGMAAVVGSALGFEHIGGYIPCALCLLQRNPYYIGIPLGILAVVSAALRLPAWITRSLLGLIGILMLVGGGTAIYHAGVEWKFWEGPASCTVSPAGLAAGAGNVLDQLNSVKGPSCTDATLRVLGLSFAGWNVLTSAALAAIAFFGASRK
ncbi:MAG: disulfide bond formation protein B [Allorhizobium sp.]